MKRVAWWTLTVLATLVAVYGFVFLWLPMPENPVQTRFLDPLIVGLAHVYGGGIALLLGPWQFRRDLRARHLDWHRWLGRAYLMGVLASALAGLYSATRTEGGLPGQIGFGMLASLWLISGALALTRIRAGDRAAHERWMVRNYALTYAAVTLRFMLPAAMASGLDFQMAYGAIAWLCWVPNLIVADWVILRPRRGLERNVS